MATLCFPLSGHRRNSLLSRFLFALLVWLSNFAAAHGQITSITQTKRGVLLTTSSNVIELQPWSDRSIRVQIALGNAIPAKTSLAVVDTSPPAPWTVQDQGSSVRLTVGTLTASVEKKTALITFMDAGGNVLLSEASGGQGLAPATQPSRDGLQVREAFVRDPSEHLFGMGVIADQLAQPTATVALLNNNTQIHVPVLYSSRGYGVLWDNPSKGELDLTPAAVAWQSSAGDLIDYYVMAGPSADEVIAQYRNLTGQAPMFPRWAYGFWFCKNRFKTQEEILQAAADFRSHKIPIDLIVQDYYFWQPNKPTFDGQDWGSHHFDPERYPDPKGMIADLHDKYHLHFMAVVWPKFDPGIDHAKELDSAGALFPPVRVNGGLMRFYDPFGSAGREIYGRQVMQSLLPLGVDAFWVDAAEPEMDKKLYASFDTPGGPASRIMNGYPLMHTTALYEAQRAATEEKRVVLLPRSSWAGMQREGASNWTGDIHGDWKTLAWQIRGLQNYSIAGLPYITTDIGGYAPTPESDREHFLRWFEWGSFCPIFRVHGVDRAFPWQYGPEAQAIIRSFNDLRYRLLPYIYSIAANVTQNAGTIMRPLVMDFRDDPQAVETWDQFMFGPQLMVCPVHESRYESIPLATDQFADSQGKRGGLSVTYIRGGSGGPTHLDMNASFSFARPTDHKGIRSIRYEGAFTPKDSGLIYFRPFAIFGESKLTLEGKVFTPESAFDHITVPVQATAGTAIHFTLDTPDVATVFEMLHDRDRGPVQTRSVYLPAKSTWYDFWTGTGQKGGQTIIAEAPLDRLPLYVRAGSILPMGPKLEYADEHPADPIELRVYAGADGSFTLYEDQGDGYAYEKGAFATIPISWTESTGKLKIGARQGTFPGMIATRTFRVVWVKPQHGSGIEPTQKADKEVDYSGEELTVLAQDK